MLGLLLALAAMVALYSILRYGVPAMEGDAARMTLAAEGAFLEGQIVPQYHSYQAGYGYPVSLAFLSAVTGVDVQHLQQGASLWLLVFILVVFVCYRELVGDTVTALLAAALLLIQPDFLFYILRGSHEKLTWFCMMASLWCIARSYRHRQSLGQVAIYIGCFYLLVWAMIASSVYFASTFLAALGLSFALGGVLLFWRKRDESPYGTFILRFGVAGLAGVVMIFLFITYVYGPAFAYYHTLDNIFDRLGVLLFGAEPLARPYSAMASAWRGPLAYVALVVPQFLVVASAFGGWLLFARRWNRPVATASAQSMWLLWFITTGYASLLALGVLLDFAGLLSSNLQLRLFPPFALVFTPWAASALLHLSRRLRFPRWAFALALGLVLVWAVPAALFKATNDPAFSNLWIFHLPSEQMALDWTDQHLQDSEVWVDTWPHQFDVMIFNKGYSWVSTNHFQFGYGDTAARHVLISQSTRLPANRQLLPLPSTTDHNTVYDSGDVQLHYRRPRTPYQR